MANGVIMTLTYFFVSIVYFGFFIACFIYLFKVKNNSKNQQKERGKYIENDPFIYYMEGDFCFDHYLTYTVKGAFKDFDLRIKKIKNFCTHLLIIFVLKILFSSVYIFTTIFCENKIINNKKCTYFLYILLFLYIVNEILLLIFFFILSGHYFKSDFSGFEKFSKCQYFGGNFRTDYDFVFYVKKKFITLFILILILIVLGFLQTWFFIRIIKKK